MTSANALNFRDAVWDADQAQHTVDSRLVLELFDREQVSLLRYLVWLGLDSATAEETVQESFLRLHQHVIAKGDRSNLRAWLYRVAHNLARNTQSSFRASKTSYLDDLTADVSLSSSSISVEQDLLAREQENRLQAALGRLSAAQQNCLVLRSRGLKYREIARALGLSVSTVAENVARGLEKLKENL